MSPLQGIVYYSQFAFYYLVADVSYREDRYTAFYCTIRP